MNDDDDEYVPSIFLQRRQGLQQQQSEASLTSYESCVYTFANSGSFGSLFFRDGKAALVYVGDTFKLCGLLDYYEENGVLQMRDTRQYTQLALAPQGRDFLLVITGTNRRLEQTYRNETPDRLKRGQPAAPAPPIERDICVL